jgi:hypothetical protein
MSGSAGLVLLGYLVVGLLISGSVWAAVAIAMREDGDPELRRDTQRVVDMVPIPLGAALILMSVVWPAVLVIYFKNRGKR